jgi:glycosyltransferase involved in cell wall biosynthesis
MDNKKILLGLTYYLPNISGVTQYAVILAEELVKRNYEVGVICSGRDQVINGVKVYGIWGLGIGKGFLMPSYWWNSFWIVKSHDIINCHLPSIESFWLALWGKVLGKKIIVTHHCEFNFTGTISNQIISYITYPIHWLVYALADQIISYTEDYAKTSVFLRFFGSKRVYVLPPIKLEESKLKLNFGNHKIVGFVGRIGWEKGLKYLIEAMKSVKARLIFVGPYKDVVGDSTYEEIKDNKAVLFYGPMKRDELKSFYKICDCLVLPSTNNLETFGIVQAEAMISGCPVVASNLPGVRMPVKITRMGEIANIGDSIDLAKQINIVLKKGKKYYQKNAKNLELFDFKKTVDKYEKIFQ